MDSPLSDIRIGQVTSQWAENNNLFVSYTPQLTSTSEVAKEEAFAENLRSESLCLYLTDHQTAGRGRGTHTWTDARPGSSLLSSWSFLLGIKPQPTASCLIGLAIYRACVATWPFLPWNLKAPNDIYLHDKKVAGILLENIMQGNELRLIVGLGFNIMSSPQNVDTAISLLEALPAGVPLLGPDYMSFLDRLLFEMTDALARSDEPLSPTDQLSLLVALNQHPLLKEKYTGMEADGSLLVKNNKINWMSL